jgi:hypothetical protein
MSKFKLKECTGEAFAFVAFFAMPSFPCWFFDVRSYSVRNENVKMRPANLTRWNIAYFYAEVPHIGGVIIFSERSPPVSLFFPLINMKKKDKITSTVTR